MKWYVAGTLRYTKCGSCLISRFSELTGIKTTVKPLHTGYGYNDNIDIATRHPIETRAWKDHLKRLLEKPYAPLQ